MNGRGPGLPQHPAEVVGVVALVAQHVARALGSLQQRRRDGDVGDVAGRQRQGVGAADRVGEGVDFRGLSAARRADRLAMRPPFPPKAERCALT